MPKKLDYRAVWHDARAILSAHQEAIVAIAGFFIFMSAWISAFLVPPLLVKNTNDLDQVVIEISRYFGNYWPVLLPTMLVTMYGSLAIYVILSGRALSRVSDALLIAATLFLPYLGVSLLVGWATMAGIFLLIIPGLYLLGRFAILPAVFTQDLGIGINDAVKRTWQITSGCGWAIFVLMLFVALAIRIVAGLVRGAVNVISVSLAGDGGVPILQSGVTAFFVALEVVAFILIFVAINRQLSAKTVTE